jgi:hypothetical protein
MTGDYSDIDHDTQFGIAVTGVSNANGQWQFSTDSGQSWNDIEVVSDDNALLLADDTQTRLRFQPDMDFMGGYPGDITFRIWDQYRGNTGDLNVNLNDDLTLFYAIKDAFFNSKPLLMNDQTIMKNDNNSIKNPSDTQFSYESTYTDNFPGILKGLNISLAVTSYQSRCLFFIDIEHD